MTRTRMFGGITIVASLAILALLVPRIAATQPPVTPPVKAGTTYIPVGVTYTGTHAVAYLIAVPTGGNPYAVACISSVGSQPECKAGAPLP